jgi:hypothetical protein
MNSMQARMCGGLIAVLAGAPIFAQKGGGGAGAGGGLGGGLGLGHATGAATESVNGSVNGTLNDQGSIGVRGNGRGLGESTNGALGVTENAHLAGQLQPLLPSSTTLPAAAAGFENQGQFISALHVAHNLNIPFDQLKSQVTGTKAMPLGKAIQKLRPDVDSKAVKDSIKLADKQTERDLQQAASGNKPERFVGRLTSDMNLSARLTALLPPGTTLANAATGFKNEGQFIAALHVAKNLNIPFADLKDRVTAGESLGAAIHELKPAMDVKAADSAAAEADAQAKSDRVDASASASNSASAQVNTK